MPRVASLYLPHFAIERIRAADARAAGRRPEPVEASAAPGAHDAATTGWRPGARWARDELAANRAEVAAQVESLPAHRRPPIRELGRRSEAAPVPFRRSPRDEAAGLAAPDLSAVPPVVRRGSPPQDRDGGLIRQMVREFAPLPERGRMDRDAGAETRRLTTKPMVPYDLEGAFWQSPHAIAGELRSRWDDPGTSEAAAPSRSGEEQGVGCSGRGSMPRPMLSVEAAESPGAQTRAPTPSPSLKGRGANHVPLVTAAREGQKIVVAALCPHACTLGLAPGMALTFARALVSALDVRDADPDGDAAALRALAIRAARLWTPVAAADGADGLWLDWGSAPLFGGEARMAARLLRWLARRGFTARIAIADSAGAAHALARHAAAPVALCPPGDEAAAVAALPVAGLRLDATALATLHRLGLERIGQLLTMPRGPLARRFGERLVVRLDQATGRRGEAIEAVVPPGRIAAACRFAEPIATAEAIATALRRLAGELVAALRAAGRGARRVALVCRRIDGHDEVATIGTARPTRDAAHLCRLIEPGIETIDPGFGIEAMRLEALRSDPLGPAALGDLAAPDAPDLAPLVDLLAGRLGARRLYRLGGVESDVPERSVAPLAPLGPDPAPHVAWPRPARLLDPPEPVEHVVAELPDQPPRRFRWRGRLHRVAAADGPERIHGEWWRAAAEADAVRDYFQVEDEAGRRFWLFRRGDGTDARTGDLSWHMQGLFG